MLPSAAEMPPCAATVCERVGNTLVMQAVRRPFWARPKVARRPAPPAPTTTMSYWCSMILYSEVMSGSGQQGDAADRVQRRERAERAGQGDEQLQRDLGRARVHVVLEHDLHAELGVPEQQDGGERQGDRVPRPGDGGLHRHEV